MLFRNGVVGSFFWWGSHTKKLGKSPIKKWSDFKSVSLRTAGREGIATSYTQIEM
jgi:TRAP-type C4-dicarboxylate transport system substrate-binding protein